MSMAPQSPSSHVHSDRSAGRVPLFCLPHAGGAAGHFAAWRRWLPAGIDPVGLDLPGHGVRQREALVQDWSRLVADLTRTVAERAGAGRYALAGHSLGGLLAFDVARTMQATGNPPALLLVAGRNGPTTGQSHRPIHDLPEPQLVDALRRLGGTPEVVLNEPDLMELFLPILRVDLRLAENYARRPGPALPCPIAAFVGRQDKMADVPGALTWHRETSDTFHFTVINAGHFLLDHPAFTAAAAVHLGQLVGRPATG